MEWVSLEENDISKTMHLHETGPRLIPASLVGGFPDIEAAKARFMENLKGPGSY